MKKIILLLGIVLILTSCHSEYVNLDYDIHRGAVWNDQHNKIAFVASKKAFRSATGISKFPDGGTPDYLLENMGLYLFNSENQELTKLIDFNDLVDWLGASRSKWNVKIAFTDSLIYYNILPVSDWDLYLSWAKTAEDSSMIYSLKEKYSKTYLFNVITKNVSETDSALFLSLYQKSKEANKISLTDLNQKLLEVPLAEWGLVVNDIYPKTDEDYIEETIYLYNESAITRRAVIEQIISKMSKEEIKAMLKKMDEYKSSLEGLEKTEYEIYSEETYKSIQKLL